MIDQIRVVAPESVAKVLCAALRAWMQTRGDWSMPLWEDLGHAGRNALTEIVRTALRRPGEFGPDDLHTLVCSSADRHGWSPGPVHDTTSSKSPYLAPWLKLPQQCRLTYEMAALQLDALSKWGTK